MTTTTTSVTTSSATTAFTPPQMPSPATTSGDASNQFPVVLHVSSDQASLVGKSAFENTFFTETGFRMLMPFSGRSIVFQLQAVSKTVKTMCRGLLEREGRDLKRLDATFLELNGIAATLKKAVAAMDYSTACTQQEFFDVFKERCALLGVNTRDRTLPKYSLAVTQHLEQQLRDPQMLQTARAKGKIREVVASRRWIIETMRGRSDRLIYLEMGQAYARQPIALITIDSYRFKVPEMEACDHNFPVNIETYLRQALLKHHPQAFNEEANAYLDVSSSNVKVAALKATLLQRLTAQKDALEAELATLRGPTGFNGTIDAAYKRIEAALPAFEAAKSAHTNGFAWNWETTDAALQQTSDEHWAAKQQHYRLKDRLKELATFTWNPATGTSDITGGEVFKARQRLNDATSDLDSFARAEATKIGNFYRELHIPVTDANKQDRYDALHAIIDA